MMTKAHIHQDKINEWAADPTYPWQYKSTASGKWYKCNGEPGWQPDVEYRRKPRWFDMEQEWIAKGKPPVKYLQYIQGTHECWLDVNGEPEWNDNCEYRIKPTPHPNADVLRALAENGSLDVSVSFVQADNLVERLWVTPPIGYILSVELRDK